MGRVFRVSRWHGLYHSKSLTQPQPYDERCQECDQRPEETLQTEGKTVYTFGAYRDQSEVSLTTILANAIIMPKVLRHLAKAAMGGNFKPQPYFFTMATDVAITFVYNPEIKNKVPESAQKAVEEAKAKIISGELKVEQTYFTEEE